MFYCPHMFIDQKPVDFGLSFVVFMMQYAYYNVQQAINALLDSERIVQ